MIFEDTTCVEAGFAFPSRAGKSYGDPFFGANSTVNVWASDLIAFGWQGTKTLLHKDSRVATMTDGRKWRKDNPQCDMHA